MPQQIRKDKIKSGSFRRGTVVHADSRTQRERTRGDTERKALTDEMDSMLQEIDDVLEVNAEAFVKSYVQLGGE